MAAQVQITADFRYGKASRIQFFDIRNSPLPHTARKPCERVGNFPQLTNQRPHRGLCDKNSVMIDFNTEAVYAVNGTKKFCGSIRDCQGKISVTPKGE
ncbi:MAG: hypothetical protein IJU76_09205 [Desulfovibrionaceae bacterium]|nr:hypothetical protein [Desulfovibrionaceae bacterium]